MKYRTFITEDKVGGKLLSRNKDKKLFDEIYDKLLSKYSLKVVKHKGTMINLMKV